MRPSEPIRALCEIADEERSRLDPYITRAVKLSGLDSSRVLAPSTGEGAECSPSGQTIVLPFPPSSLSGHAKGHWRAKAAATKKQREWARLTTLAAKVTVPAEGDIALHIRFVPPDRRGDRTNFPARLKGALDGIADALGVNDRRFAPTFTFAEPEKPGRVIVTVGAA